MTANRLIKEQVVSKAESGIKGLSPEESNECRFFMEAVEGLSARQAAKAILSIAPGADLAGVSKGVMARRWACRDSPVGDLGHGLTREDLLASVEELKARNSQ